MRRLILMGIMMLLGNAALCLPNIVFILADDMGVGDVSCLNPEGKISTPHIDRLAKEGMTFTDGHSSSAVCTPTRYSILTGRYNWRSPLKTHVLTGPSEPLIPTDRLTVASLLKHHGYHTGCIGKWHLGLGWARKDDGSLDYTKPISGGPTDLGFDTFFGISASLDMPPYIWIQNDSTVGVPTVIKGFDEPYRPGDAHKDFEAVDVLPEITRKAVAYIEERAKINQPFFLYLPLNAPHTPILPAREFVGKTGIGSYGDFAFQVDWTVGQVMDALERTGEAKDTLIIFTSDNGCSPMANFEELAKHGHFPSRDLRGHKADIYEGGHRVPFIVRWTGKTPPGSIVSQTVCQVDFMRTAAEIVGATLPDNAGEDSYSLVGLLTGTQEGILREATVHHSINGSFAIRKGDWKLALCPGSGGWSDPRPADVPGDAPPHQLFRLSSDIGEQTNLANRYPEKVAELSALLQKYIDDGRSTPGVPQMNDEEFKFTR